MNSFNFANLPDINFAELNPAEVESLIINGYEGVAGHTLYPGDPVRLFLEGLAYVICIQNSIIDTAGKQNLLAHAIGDHLDHLGVLMNTPRLNPTPAVTVIRYQLEDALAWEVIIPQGSRVSTGGGEMVFATDAAAVISPGQLHVDVPATAIENGTRCNNLVPGQINRQVDPIAYIKTVANLTGTVMGSDREGDEPYRRRIQLAPEHFSVAGPEGAYLYHALSTHPDIADCSVWRPIPGTVDVRPIMKNGELPGPEIIEAVRERLNDKRVRPLTDTVIVAAPEIVTYELKGKWYLHRKNEPLMDGITKKVQEAAEEYRLWQRSLPGRDINPAQLIALVVQAGAKRAELESPDFQKLEERQIARETVFSLEFGGLEDE